jgi:nicotinamide-nucleotide amidase
LLFSHIAYFLCSNFYCLKIELFSLRSKYARANRLAAERQAAYYVSMFDPILSNRAGILLAAMRKRGMRCTTAESCTGGLVAALLTAIPGSSDVVDRGFVTYSNEAKQEMLGVPANIISNYGAVSAECAEAMARGALQNSRADIAVSITGIAGPGGGSEAKPVGLVYFGVAVKNHCKTIEMRFGPLSRDKIREASVSKALELLQSFLD